MALKVSRRVQTEEEAAEYTNFSRRTLQKWRVVGGGPKYLKIGRAVRYRVEDLDAFLGAGVRRNTSESR
jgi:excisionase family DNA binding protein